MHRAEHRRDQRPRRAWFCVKPFRPLYHRLPCGLSREAVVSVRSHAPDYRVPPDDRSASLRPPFPRSRRTNSAQLKKVLGLALVLLGSLAVAHGGLTGLGRGDVRKPDLDGPWRRTGPENCAATRSRPAGDNEQTELLTAPSWRCRLSGAMEHDNGRGVVPRCRAR